MEQPTRTTLEKTMAEDFQTFFETDDLRDRKFNKILDSYLSTGTMLSGDYESLSARQKDVVQCIKRSFARLS